MTDATRIDPTTAERLMRLRVLLTAALAASGDTTPAGRHVAVIFLDGVCEQALHLAADQLGIEVTERQGMLDVYSMVAGQLTSWDKAGAKGVRELHRTRNNVQHHAVLPDAEHLPIWASEVDRFVHGLIVATYQEELANIRASSAVEDDDLRAGLERADEALAEGRVGASFEASRETLERAVDRFRNLRGQTSGSMFGFNPYDEFRKIERSFEGLERFMDVAYLSSDPGEWLWMEATANAIFQTGQPPNRDEAQRAYAFALSWILRYEAFAARFPQGRTREREEPSLDARYDRPQVVDLLRGRRASFGDDSIEVIAELDQVPPGWAEVVHTAVRSLQDAERAPTGIWVSVNFEDDLLFQVPDTLSPVELSDLIECVIDETQRLFEERLESHRRKHAADEQVADRYRAALKDDPCFGALIVDRYGLDDTPWIEAEVNLPEDAQAGGIADELNRHFLESHRTRAHFRDHTLRFPSDMFAPEEIAPALAEAIASAARSAAERAAVAQERAERREGLIADARRLLEERSGRQ